MKNRSNTALYLNSVVWLLLLVHSTGNAQLKAGFTSSSPAGCTPLVVQFTNASSGSPTSFFWDFGNGSTSTLENPGAIYSVPGKYTVTLVVQDNAGNADTLVKPDYITVYSKPVIDFEVTPQEGCGPLQVKFTDKSNPSSGSETAWAWDFGDGQVSNAQNPSHTYVTIDTFSVSLKVTNSFGCSDILQKKDIVKVDGVNNLNFDYTYNNACSPPTKVTFTNTTNSANSISYQWFFGDGGSSTQQNPVYTYTTNGTFNVQLVATTNDGCSDTTAKTISIGTISPNFIAPTDACAQRKVVFMDSSTPSPIYLEWDFGDGVTAVGATTSHVYNNPGSYNVKLVANFGACTDSITKIFTVTDKPSASFTSAGNRATCSFPSTIQFQNTSSSAVSYVWNFGDGTKSNVASPLHTFSKAGYYDVTLIAFNSNGCSDTLFLPKYVQLGPPRIDSLEGAPFAGCVNSLFDFKAAVSSGENISAYAWDFGDGAASGAATPSHAYTKAGVYTVSLKVTTSSGCSASAKFGGVVRVGNHSVAKFSASPLNVCGSGLVKFTDHSSGNPSEWQWDFGDGTGGSIEQNPTYSFADTGVFTITLSVYNNGCLADTQRLNYIHVTGAIAKFSYQYQCDNRYLRNFTDESINAQKWSWDFGDGMQSSEENPSHTYPAPGTYYTRLTVTNGSCSDTKIDTLIIVDPTVSFNIIPPQKDFCKYSTITLKAKYNSSFANSFSWNFDDGTNSGFSSDNNIVTHQYKRAGTYAPYLVVKDILGCFDTAKNTNQQLNVFGPKADFTNTAGACLHGTILFTDKSTTDATPHAIKQWIWDYGDGSTQSLTINDTPFTHVYNTTGIYSVKLKVVDEYGCFDSTIKTHLDTIAHPIADFSAEDSVKCSISPVNFIDSSQGVSLTYAWDFGDSTNSNTASPQHIYSKTGIYTVALNITDRFGCTASVVKKNYIKISDPVASFSIADTVHYCPPWAINPKSTSKNYTFLTWQFGDGNSSNLANPQHTYIAAGHYNLLLIAQGHGNCFDTAKKTLTLLGPSGTFSYSVSPLCLPGKVSFSATGKNIAGYQWFFGDGQIEVTTVKNLSYTYKTPGVYLPLLTLVDSSGNCQVQVQNAGDSIRVADVKANFGAATAPGCDSALVSFTDSSQIFFDTLQSVKWKFGDGDSSVAANPSHYYFASGNKTVVLEVTTNIGCTSVYKLPVDVVVHQSPVVNAVIPPSVCINTSAGFTASNSSSPPGTLEWLWQFGDGGTDTQPNTSYTYTTANTYPVIVTATNEFGCADTVQSNITVQPLPVVDAGIDSTICLGAAVTLQPSGASTYEWASSSSLSCTNCTNPLAAPDSSTTYYVAGTSAAGCVNIDSVTITVKQRTSLVLQPAVDTLCLGNSLQLNASGAEEYNWQPAAGLNNTTIADPVASPITTTTYTLIGSDSNKCFFDTATVIVEVFPNPTVSFADTGVTIMVGDHYTLVSNTSPDVTKWLWLPPAGLSCNSCAQPVAAPRLTTKYTETVFNQYGCSATASFNIVVLCNEQSLFIPNTFSPNGDGVNDYFYPRGPNIYRIKSMRIFNRWGQVVFYRLNFTANDTTNAWDGKYQGKAQPSDVYVYSIDVVCDNGTILTSKGNVTLLR